MGPSEVLPNADQLVRGDVLQESERSRVTRLNLSGSR